MRGFGRSLALSFALLPAVAADATCASNAACAALLLAGDCCPHEDGIMLDCCTIGTLSAAPPAASPTVAAPPAATSPAASPCASPALAPVVAPSPSAASPSPSAASPTIEPAPVHEDGSSVSLDGKPLGDASLGSFPRAGPHPQQPTKAWGSKHSAPLPTNRWWINLVLDDGGAVGENVVSSLPYVMKAVGDGLHVCLPVKEASETYVTLPFDDTLVLGAVEMGTSASRTVEAFDDLSVTVAWTASSGGTMTAPLVRGMPYASATFLGDLTPKLTFATSPVTAINGQPAHGVLTGERFEVTLGNGQTWVVYAGASVKVHLEGASLTFDAPYNGLLRAACATSPESQLAVLDAHAKRVPTGGVVATAVDGDVGVITMAFAAEGDGELLTMALPHHLDVEGRLVGVSRTELKHTTLKGEMVGLVGDTWTLREALPVVDWGAPRPIDASRADEIRASLNLEKEKPFVVPDPYGAGKELGAVARLALIADELGEADTASALRARLAAKLEEWLSGKGVDALTYEPTYGGMVSVNGLADRAADFGGGWYNDHHFHYGYFVYAAAAVGKTDSAWLTKWSSALNHLVRDIANPSKDDALYSRHRFKDWYVGHSWASGLFPSASGRNQESVSEALNAWYGIALYGLAMGDDRLRDLGRLLLATELRSGYQYWQIAPGSTTYPEPFAANGLAAVVWSTKVDKTTWFGSNVEYAYGIQAMPVTPITEVWLRPEWLRATQPVWGSSMDTASEQWRGIIMMMAAVLQPADAWKNAHRLTLFDNGNTLTNVLYWIATRPKDGENPVTLGVVQPVPPAGGGVWWPWLVGGVVAAALGAFLALPYTPYGKQLLAARAATVEPAGALPEPEAQYERL